MTIQFHDDVYEFQFNTAYFTVTPQEYFYIHTDERAARDWRDLLAQRIKKELLKRGGGIIWWRIPPEIDHAKVGCDSDVDPQLWTEEDKRRGEEFFCWIGYARFATSPSLPDEVTTLLGVSAEEYKKTMRKLREKTLAELTV
jgi:hypothetical protein